MMTTVLSQLNVQTIITEIGVDRVMCELIEKLEEAFQGFDPQHTKVSLRSGFNYDAPRQGLVEWMPLLESGKHVFMKMVGYHPQNPNLGRLPTILSDFSLYDATTGRLEAIVDGTVLTALRTGAASAIASRVLANPESHVIGLVGCGAQAVTQLHAISQLFNIDRVGFFDVDTEAMNSFEQRCLGIAGQAVFEPMGLDGVVATSDILCVGTSIDIGGGPVFDDQATKQHLHINAIGSDFPGKVELPVGLLKRSFVTPDIRAQADVEGECQQLDPQDIGEELFELIRMTDRHAGLQKQTTVFDSTGWVPEDYVVTKLFLDYADQLGVGSRVSMGTLSIDPKSPYEFLRAQELGDQATASTVQLAKERPVASTVGEGAVS